MSSLPRNIPNRLQDVADISAYNICLRVEKSLQLAIDKGEDVGTNLIYVRVLGYLIHYVPTDQGLKNVVEEINACAEDDLALLAVGKFYFDHFIRAFRANRNSIPTPFSDESPRSFDTLAEMMKATSVEAPQSHKDAKTNALIRDGYRCLVSRKYDVGAIKENRELAKLAMLNPTAGATHLQCAHIFSESINLDIGEGTDKQEYAPNIWTLMERFGYPRLAEDLNGTKVHRLENVLTLSPELHTPFDHLEFWFVAVKGKANTYKLDAILPYILHGCPKFVTFTTTDPVKLPVPSPDYLTIHAACAQVAHFSGAAEWIDQLYEDMEECMTLDPDGASASILEHAIFELKARR